MHTGALLAVGGLGLFLLGMVVLTDGLRQLAGDALRRTLARFTKTPLSGAVTGAVSTAIIQSSSATTVTAIGFVGAGLLTFSQALGIIFGANMGTTITGWFVAILGFKLKIGELALPLVLLGVLMHMFAKRRLSAAGLAVAGFGVIFVGIGYLQEGMSGLEGVVTPDSFPGDTLGGRLLLVLIGIGITLVTQSSSAGVATALAAVHSGTINFNQAAAMVIGMDIGTTATAALATIGGSTESRRTGLAHVFYNMQTGVGAFFLLGAYTWACDALSPRFLLDDPEIALVAFHTLFNTLGVILVLPFTQAFARMVIRLIPERSATLTRRLDVVLYESPSMAIEAARATLEPIARLVFRNLVNLLEDYSISANDENLEEASEALNTTRDYLGHLATSSDDELLSSRHASAFHAIDHLRRLIDRCEEVDRAEHAGDAASLSPLAGDLRAATAKAFEDIGSSESSLEEDLKALWQQIESAAEQHRHDFVQQAARGQLDAQATIANLDASRWLRRVAYHVWRIVHHLDRIKPDGESAAADIPPHCELEAEVVDASAPADESNATVN